MTDEIYDINVEIPVGSIRAAAEPTACMRNLF
jgi:hypothetical protein